MKKEKVNLASNENLERLPSESASFNIDGIEVKVDQAKVDQLKKRIEDRKKELSKKVYAVHMDSSCFSSYKQYIFEEAEWSSTEALGIIEISKSIQKVEKEGIKDNMIYLGALTIEASHYFIGKNKGKGLQEAQNFIKLYKSFDVALSEIKEDNEEIKKIQTELNAAEQGLETC